jgi:O-methyltransferase involved in polyketide biosynthesis
MSDATIHGLSDVAETLLITVYVRALETQRPDALIKDENALALVTRFPEDFARVKQVRMDAADQAAIGLRSREFDRYAREFIGRNPAATVVHLGCGLDARFERVDDGRVEWYDLDLPEVIDLRRTFMGGEEARHHLLACSMFDSAWPAAVATQAEGRPALFLAEGVFMYFEEAQLKSLVLRLQARFPAAELVFDAFSPYNVWTNNLRLALTKMGARYRWAPRNWRDLELWGEGICLLDSWGYFDRPEPRLAHIWWMRHIPLFAQISRVLHYRLGTATR